MQEPVQTEKISVTFFARRLKAFLSGPFAILETIVLTATGEVKVPEYHLGSSQTLVSRKNEEFRQRQNKNQGTNQHSHQFIGWHITPTIDLSTKVLLQLLYIKRFADSSWFGVIESSRADPQGSEKWTLPGMKTMTCRCLSEMSHNPLEARAAGDLAIAQRVPTVMVWTWILPQSLTISKLYHS